MVTWSRISRRLLWPTALRPAARAILGMFSTTTAILARPAAFPASSMLPTATPASAQRATTTSNPKHQTAVLRSVPTDSTEMSQISSAKTASIIPFPAAAY